MKNKMMKKVRKSACPEFQEVQLKYRTKVKPSERPRLGCSKEVAEYLRNIWNEDDIELFESFYCIFLSRNHKVMYWLKLSQGGINGTVADIRLLFTAAVAAPASAIILAHNHPSGNLHPSNSDRALTKKIVEAAKLFEMNVLDHLILTAEDYYSFADEGEL